MNRINGKRVLIGALAGGVTWSVWTSIVAMKILIPTYMAEERLGHVLAQPRYGLPVFFMSWFLAVFLISGIGAWLYAIARNSLGAGPITALKIGAALGFAAGVPINLSVVSWYPVVRSVPFWWMADMWIGVILAVLVAGFLYQDKLNREIEPVTGAEIGKH
ncbi:MAG: hypothetical protein ACRER7_02310 [Gammaproteobacteria bacterium]